MNFYQLLQLDPSVLWSKIRQSQGKQKYYYGSALVIRDVLLVGFAILMVSGIGAWFGDENKSLAVVLFCMLLTLRMVDFGYKITESIVSIAAILGIFALLPWIVFQQNIVLKWILNFICLLIILSLTGMNPKMGNAGLYGFSYVFLMETTVPLSQIQYFHRLELLGLFFVFFSILFFVKHRHKNKEYSWRKEFLGDNLFSERNLWVLYCSLGLSIILLIGDLFPFERFMWVGFAFSSLLTGYGANVKERLKDRIIGIIIGSCLYCLGTLFIPSSILGILGGLALGLCSTYRSKTIFNCFGALSVASAFFPVEVSISLRILNNLAGLIFFLLYMTGFKLMANSTPVKNFLKKHREKKSN